MNRVGTTGNALEWYDFELYGYLAPMIGALMSIGPSI